MNKQMIENYQTEEFNQLYFYNQNDLGAVYTASSTTFKLWAPTASTVQLLLFSDGEQGNVLDTVDMQLAPLGVWTTIVQSNLHGIYYNYNLTIEGKTEIAVDPYAQAVGVNGNRGMVIDLTATDPENWELDLKPSLKNPTDAIIYELHVRDCSISKLSGIKNRGKFLGLIEEGTKSPDGLATGLDHLKELGITHLHLLPSFDYESIDETRLDENNYNWGYDPVNYNVPEGSYATDPFNGEVRIREYKEMVLNLHTHGIRVVMDVVYNHTGKTIDSNFNKIVPYYYYRTVNGEFSNGSACGNETASDHLMVRKMIIDSVVYWAKEYHVDGFRFDLMGLHDLDTMNAIRVALDAVDPTIIIYGEGWTGGPSPLSDEKKALKKNTPLLKGIAAFSDDMRDSVKGHVFDSLEPGFVNGKPGMEAGIQFGVVASTNHPQVDYTKIIYSDAPWANTPAQTINYVSAHDNLTLWDKLTMTNPNDTDSDRILMDKLSNAIVLTSQGIPFIHAGEEMLRTKNGDENSFRSPDSVNQIDWTLKSKNIDVFKYYQGLIAFRKAHPALRMTTTEDIGKNLIFFDSGKETNSNVENSSLQLPSVNMVGFMINNHANDDRAESICIIYNATRELQTVKIPMGDWSVYVNAQQAGTEVIEVFSGDHVSVNPLSAFVCCLHN